MSIRQYVSAYRVYSEHITVLVKEALAEDLTVERVSNFLATADRLKISTVYIYDSLIVLSEQLGSQDGMDGKQNTNEGTGKIVLYIMLRMKLAVVSFLDHLFYIVK